MDIKNMDLEEAYSELQILDAQIKSIVEEKDSLAEEIYDLNKEIIDLIEDGMNSKGWYSAKKQKDELNDKRLIFSDLISAWNTLSARRQRLLIFIKKKEKEASIRKLKAEAEKERKELKRTKQALYEENLKKQKELSEVNFKKKQALKEENIRKSNEKDESEFRILRNLLKEKFGLEWFVALMDEVRVIKANVEQQGQIEK